MFRSELIEKPDDKSKKWRVCQADHFGDVLDFIEKTPPAWKGGYLASEQEHGGASGFDAKMGLTDSWAGTQSLKEALELCRTGWDQGIKLLSETLDAANIVQKQSRVLSEGLDVAGSMPFVPAAVAGDPMCMVSRGLERARTKPIFRIMMSGSASAGVSMQTIINRGGAILSWVDKLEGAGYQCELLYVYDVTESGWGGRSGNVTEFSCGFPIKSAGEPLNIDRAAFMMAHPAMLRRFIFALYERFGDVEPNFRSGYGMPNNNIPPMLQVDHSIYFRALHSGEGDWKNPATAIVAVERAILKALTQETIGDDLREQMEWEAA